MTDEQSRRTRPDPFAFDVEGRVVEGRVVEGRVVEGRVVEGRVVDLTSGVGELGRDRCIELLESTPIGRVGFMTEGGPLVLPVNFAWHDGAVVFRTLEGQKLAATADDRPVCFEVDHWDPEDRTGWSVVVRGEAREVTQWAEREQLEHIGLVPWTRDTWRPLWVRIRASEISGRILR